MVNKKKVIDIERLSKNYKNVKAVDDLSFSVYGGELFAFLGVNGAGKSTTINIISGILNKDGGKVFVCGEDIDRDLDNIKSRIGIVFQSSVLDKNLSALENLKSRAALYGIFGSELNMRIDELDDLLEIKRLLPCKLSTLSGGQRRKIDIARALIHSPELLILDEPTTGLDPKTRIAVWSTIEKLRLERGLTVLLTTHYMEEAASAEHVVILDGGKKVAEGTPHELKTLYASDYLRFYSHINEASRIFGALKMKMRRERDFLEVEVKNTSDIVRYIRTNPEVFNDFEAIKGNMDSVFLNVTGKDIREA